MSDNLMTYGQHLIGVFICLAIAILAIPGWLICCSCCCCNCCCCCCCKKPTCKFPFFIVTLALYVLVAGICLYGLIKSNSIFRGLSDTECSILKFFNETIEGETKAEKPKWAGVEGIKSLLDEVADKIESIKGSTVSDLTDKRDSTSDEKTGFESALSSADSIYDSSKNKVSIGSSEYRLDITEENFYTIYKSAWQTEYNTIATQSQGYLDNAISNFNF